MWKDEVADLMAEGVLEWLGISRESKGIDGREDVLNLPILESRLQNKRLPNRRKGQPLDR